MEDLKAKYDGRQLTTDEAAVAGNEIATAIKELESIKYTTGPDHLWLKWGTLKSWKLTSARGKQLLEQYFALGSAPGAMQQHDTPEQKELICKMIDEVDGTLGSDWSGELFTKTQAKDYVRGYDQAA